jgi:hypothetical protein
VADDRSLPHRKGHCAAQHKPTAYVRSGSLGWITAAQHWQPLNFSEQTSRERSRRPKRKNPGRCSLGTTGAPTEEPAEAIEQVTMATYSATAAETYLSTQFRPLPSQRDHQR